MIRRCLELFSSVWPASTVALLIALGLSASLPAAAQGWELSAVYGRGVHAYFANQTSQADQLLSEVIEAGSSPSLLP